VSPDACTTVSCVPFKIAASSVLELGLVFDATVSGEGRVTDVKVLHVAPRQYEKTLVAAMRKSTYEPLIRNGIPTPFVTTVTFTIETANLQPKKLAEMLRDRDEFVREQVSGIIEARASRFNSEGRKRLGDALRMMLESEQNDRVKVAATKALYELAQRKAPD
jgi:TonB family protein